MREGITMKKIGNEQGFALIEVLAAGVILVVLVMAFLGYYISGHHAITKTGDEGRNLYKAQQDLENKSNVTSPVHWEYTYPSSTIKISGDVVKSTISGNQTLTELTPN